MSIQALLLSEDYGEQRRDMRWLVSFGAASHDQNAQQHRLAILDLSVDGFLMETPRSLPANACLAVQMPSGTHKICKIVWNRGQRHGAVFSDPLTETEFESLIASNVVAHLPTPNARNRRLQLCQSPPQVAAQTGGQHDERYPRAFRLLIAIGTSAGLWGIIGTALWQAAV